jgi:hypothetical protein
MKRFDIIFFVICFFSVVFVGSAFATCSGDPGECPPPLNDIDLNGLPDSADPYYTYKGIAIGQPKNYYVRTMADVTSDGHPDLIGFGEKGVFVAPYNENEGDFDSPQLWTRKYASAPAPDLGWNILRHLRLLADVNGDGAADIVGFGDDGVRVSIADPAGKSFNGYELWSNEFGWNDDWKDANSIRMLGDVNNDGYADIIGFRDKVYVALSNGTNGFDIPLEYGFSATRYICCRSPWNAKDNPTFLGDVDNDGFLDIIGFGTNNVRVVKNFGVNGSGQFLGFGSQVKGSSDFCEDDNAGGSNNWSTSKHLRYIAEVDNDGHADIVGFGDNGVYVAFGQSDGTFNQQVFKGIFGYENGWKLSHPRILADVDGDGDLDIVGFGSSSVEVSMFDNTTKTFGDTVTVSPDAVHHSGRGWSVGRHPRFMADLNNDGKADIIGLANMGARVSISSSTTAPDYEPTETLSTQFGYHENAGMWQPDHAIYGKFAYNHAQTGDSYLILTTQEIIDHSEMLDEFVNHKEDIGYDVHILPLNENMVSPEGRVDFIRNTIKQYYDIYGIKYVLLIGDPEPFEGGLPMLMTYINDTSEIPTDYYYADLSGNWDLNGDGIYANTGDGGSGGVDFVPEVYVGRIPVYENNYSQLDEILLKTINYENETITGAPSWRNTIMYAAPWLNEDKSNYKIGEFIKADYVDSSSGSSLGYEIHRFYEDNFDVNPECEGINDKTTDCISFDFCECNMLQSWIWGSFGGYGKWRTLPSGYGVVFWNTHGSSKNASHLINSSDTTYLSNSRPSFVLSMSCNTGNPENQNNLGYSLLKNGAVTVVAPSRSTTGNHNITSRNQLDFDNAIAQAIGYNYIKSILDEESAGEALYNTKAKFNYNRYWRNKMAFNLYGDPSLSVR